MSTPIEHVKKYILAEFLKGEAPENLKPDTELMSTGVLDSLSTLQLVKFLEDTFGVKIDASELDEENFGSLARIEVFLSRKGR